MKTRFFNDLKHAPEIMKTMETHMAVTFLQKNLKIEVGEVKPKSWWATLFWPIIKELVSYLLQLLVLRLNEDVEDILKK